MRSHAKTIIIFLSGIASLAVSQTAPDLLTALRQSGASRFADRLAADTETLNVFLTVAQTVFAPSDLTASPGILQERALSPLAQQQARLQACGQESRIAQQSMTLPGSTIPTLDNSGKLNGAPQRVVIDNRPTNTTNPTRRWDSFGVLKRQSIAPGSLRISSGLGRITNVVKANIPFDKGVIHVIDDYFTLPQPLSTTTQLLGQTAFASLASSSNLTAKLDNTQSVTLFLPSNTALSSSNNLTASEKSQLVSNHIVPGFVGYLPDLVDGAALISQTGEALTIKIRDGFYYVNDARITQANIILDGGVAHIIDRPLTPKGVPQPPKVPTSGSLPNQKTNMALTAGLAGIVGLFALF
ncbi:Fasciclin-like arabinogalactan protein CTB11 [Cladobotryum mycophilum]|uniref:Fasciclin-like arabinogalactan protein CTB11 n=1 Tax=Cladobotryum mycophilum TaxID=491253 RepID=A0ABR0SBK0_9HYPO